MPKIGVLALQGDFVAHLEALRRLGADGMEVRSPADLAPLDGLIIPGGESTAFLRLMRFERMDSALLEFHHAGRAIFGTCAGLILLARSVLNPPQESLGLIDVTVERNAYGRQVESFVAEGRVSLGNGSEERAEMVFIRAPRIRALGAAVRALGWSGDDPVLAREGSVLVSTFHPEMGSDLSVHRYFLEMSMRSS